MLTTIIILIKRKKELISVLFCHFGGNNRTRTYDILLVRQALSQLSYAPILGDPYGNRTHVTAVKGRCLNRLTKGPYIFSYTVASFNWW